MLVTGQRLSQLTQLGGTRFMLLFQAIKQRRCAGVTRPEQLEQIGIFLGMVEPLHKRINVMDHCPKQDEVRLDSHVANFAYYVEHPIQHCGQRTVLLLDNAFSLHGISLLRSLPCRAAGRALRHARWRSGPRPIGGGARLTIRVNNLSNSVRASVPSIGSLCPRNAASIASQSATERYFSAIGKASCSSARICSQWNAA